MYEPDKKSSSTNPAGLEATYNSRAERRAALRAKSEAILRPAFRRWAYGVAVAAVAAAAFAGWIPPAASTVLVPLIMAFLYVDENGEPKA